MPRSQQQTITKLTLSRQATQATIDALKLKQDRINTQLRAAEKRERQHLHLQLGRLVDEAGLGGQSQADLTRIFTYIGKIVQGPGEFKAFVETLERGQI
jgi:hypothetical protein